MIFCLPLMLLKLSSIPCKLFLSLIIFFSHINLHSFDRITQYILNHSFFLLDFLLHTITQGMSLAISMDNGFGKDYHGKAK